MLSDQYHKLGFGIIADEAFKQLVLAGIIEPTSRLDTVRALGGLGLNTPSNASIHRCLRRVTDCDYRPVVSKRCFEKAS